MSENTQQNGTENGKQMNNKTEKQINKVITLDGRLVKTYEYGDCMVLIYEVIPEPFYPLEGFYIVTLDDTSTEIAWGIGSDEEEALESAAEAYDNMSFSDTNDFNPFRAALDSYRGEDNE